MLTDILTLSMPLLLSMVTTLLWVVVAIATPRSKKNLGRLAGAAFAVIQLVLNIWAIISFQSEIDRLGLVFWASLSLLAVFLSLRLYNEGQTSDDQGELVSLPILVFAGLLSWSASSFLVFYFGWALVSVSGFIVVALRLPQDSNRIKASLRYAILNLFAEALFAYGVFGIYTVAHSFDFKVIVNQSIPAPIAACLIAGALLRSLQLPFTRSTDYLSEASEQSMPVFLLGHLFLASVLFLNLYPVLIGGYAQWLALVPVMTALLVATSLLPERNPYLIFGKICAYVISSIFLSGLIGTQASVLSLSVAGMTASFFFVVTYLEFLKKDGVSRWIFGFATLSLLGLFGTNWGFARNLEYSGLIRNALEPSNSENFPLLLSCLILKISADLVFNVAIWSLLCETWRNKRKSERSDVINLVIMAGLAIASIGFLIGYPSFLSWFGTITANSDIALASLIISISVVVLPILLGTFWFYRDRQSSEQFRLGAEKILEKINANGRSESAVWDHVLRPLWQRNRMIVRFLEKNIFSDLFIVLWMKPVAAVKAAFNDFEDKIFDIKLTDSIAGMLESVGKSLKIIHNGQVQFYFVLGLLVMAAIVVRFILAGG